MMLACLLTAQEEKSRLQATEGAESAKKPRKKYGSSRYDVEDHFGPVALLHVCPTHRNIYILVTIVALRVPVMTIVQGKIN